MLLFKKKKETVRNVLSNEADENYLFSSNIYDFTI